MGRRSLCRFPILGLFLFQEPDLAIQGGLPIACHFIEGLDHHRCRLNRRMEPPPAQLLLTPEHAEFFIRDAAFFHGFHDIGRGCVVLQGERVARVETLQGNCHMSL